MLTPLKWREQRGLTLRAAAKTLKIAPQSLMRYERGEREWPLRTAQRLVRASRGQLALASFLPKQRRTTRPTA